LGLGDAVMEVTFASDGFRNKEGRVNIGSEEVCLSFLASVEGE